MEGPSNAVLRCCLVSLAQEGCTVPYREHVCVREVSSRCEWP